MSASISMPVTPVTPQVASTWKPTRWSSRGRPAGGRDCGGRDGLDLDFRLGDIERVAHGDEVARALARHDAGDACACEDVALFGAVLEHHGLGFRVHEDGALGDRDAFGDLLVSHVDHTHVAVLVDMCEIVAVGVALTGGGGEFVVCSDSVGPGASPCSPLSTRVSSVPRPQRRRGTSRARCDRGCAGVRVYRGCEWSWGSPSNLRHESLGAVDVVVLAGFAGDGIAVDSADRVFIAGTQGLAYGILGIGEQAGANRSVGGEAQAVARLAEMVGHGRDEPDGADRVGEGPVTRGARSKGTAVLHGLEYAEARGGSFGGDALAKLGGGDRTSLASHRSGLSAPPVPAAPAPQCGSSPWPLLGSSADAL